MLVARCPKTCSEGFQVYVSKFPKTIKFWSSSSLSCCHFATFYTSAVGCNCGPASLCIPNSICPLFEVPLFQRKLKCNGIITKGFYIYFWQKLNSTQYALKAWWCKFSTKIRWRALIKQTKFKLKPKGKWSNLNFCRPFLQSKFQQKLSSQQGKYLIQDLWTFNFNFA